MKNKKLLVYIGIVVLIVGLLIGSYFMFFYSPYKFRGDGPVKIFFLHSYHPEFPSDLVEGYTSGFDQYFEKVFEKEGIEIETSIFYMDFIRKSEEGKKEVVI